MTPSPAVERIVQIVHQKSVHHLVSTVTLSTSTGWSERTVRHYLNQAEKLGMVCRPNRPKSGWRTNVEGEVIRV